MLIPKIPKKPQPVQKKCAIPGCETIFEGSHSSKYCQVHQNPKTRTKVKVIPEKVTVKNQLLEHNYNDVKTIMQICALEGCGEQFEVKIFPKQYVYPKYCPEHRNEHKRKSYLAQDSNTKTKM